MNLNYVMYNRSLKNAKFYYFRRDSFNKNVMIVVKNFILLHQVLKYSPNRNARNKLYSYLLLLNNV